MEDLADENKTPNEFATGSLMSNLMMLNHLESQNSSGMRTKARYRCARKIKPSPTESSVSVDAHLIRSGKGASERT
jgi:hypothetical protein